MRITTAALTATLVALLALSPAQAAKVQSDGARASPNRAAAVKKVFQSSFNDYLTYARGADELLPLTKSSTGGFGNWGATFVDALTTAHIMGLDDVVQQGITFSENVNFANTSQDTISLFETNIRYVASLLSLYELTGSKNEKLISQAKVLGDKLLQGWEGDNDIPFNSLQRWTAGPSPDTTRNAIIAEAGTLLLEFDRLSKYTGDSTYRQHAVRSMKAVINSRAVLPGLYGQGISPTTNQPTDDYVTWGGGSDSFFEYLIKYGQLIGSTDTYIATWVDSVKSSIEYLLTKPGDTKAKLTYLSDYSPSNGGRIPQFTHLGCFVGGNWILGGKLLDSDGIVQYGLQLTESCINTYTSSATGIGPEVYVFKTEDGGTNGVTINNDNFYEQHGFDYAVVDYVLRPEVLESVFYAYRSTGDRRWQDLAWQAFLQINKYCKAPASLAGLQAVNSTQTAQLNDSESFLYAELLKYLYLIFDDPNNISLDAYVFNTEAHPFKIDNPNADFSAINVGTLPSPKAPSRATANSPTGTQRDVPRPRISGLGDTNLVNMLTSLLFDII